MRGGGELAEQDDTGGCVVVEVTQVELAVEDRGAAITGAWSTDAAAGLGAKVTDGAEVANV